MFQVMFVIQQKYKYQHNTNNNTTTTAIISNNYLNFKDNDNDIVDNNEPNIQIESNN